MFEPVRGGTRGGQAEFKWSDVSADKDRENYLGHSINAPTGRWQKNKDVHWYNRDQKSGEEERLEEIRRIKQLEADAISAALGFEPTKPGENATATSSNSIPVAKKEGEEGDQPKLSKEERKRLKAERKEEKKRRKEEKRSRQCEDRDREGSERGHRHRHEDDASREYERRRHRNRSRSRSPVPRHRTRDERDYEAPRRRASPDPGRRGYRSRSRSPTRTFR